MADLDALQSEIEKIGSFIPELRQEIAEHVIGQEQLISRLLVGLLTNGHVLVEGVPGLAKTLSINVLGQAIGADFSRIQFTPDLLPADLIGTQIYEASEHRFTIRKGPVFANLLLADEINRAPAKVQSGLLEAMQERHVTIGGECFQLPEPFLVMATQNPLELEGTYPLPEAQVDRFMLKVNVGYLNRDEEGAVLRRMAHPDVEINPRQVCTLADVLAARELVDAIYLDEKLIAYILDLVFATRLAWDELSDRQDPEKLRSLEPLIQYGASPRATLHLVLGAKALAFLDSRAYVTPDDIKAIAVDVLSHRIIPSYEAEAESITSISLVSRLLDRLVIP